MPTPSVADGRTPAHLSATGDTPDVATSDAITRLIADALGASRRFPAADLVDTAAGMLPAIPSCQKAGRAGLLHEGPSWRISVSPGRVRVWTIDEADHERSKGREQDLRLKAADALATYLELGEDGEWIDGIPEPIPCREITGWSAKSRANMRAAFADLDYNALFTDPRRAAAMLTLTYPGDWLTVAPNGRTVKAQLKTLRKRYKRAFGEDLACVWKLEFQRRGAPHIHMLACPPHRFAARRSVQVFRSDGTPELTPRGRYKRRCQVVPGAGAPVNFRDWLRMTWAEIVGHPDREERRRHELAGCNVDYAEGLRASDPRRVATYFAKHGGATAKEYQHCVPEEWHEPGEGPGRFWGYWVLERKLATVAVRPDVGTQAGRVLRRHSRAQQVTRQATRPRVKGGRPISKYPEVIGLAGAMLMESRTKVSYRRSRTRAVRAKNGRGWLMVNDGPAFAMELSIALHDGIGQRHTEANRAELDRSGLWSTPLARALRLPPSRRRDELVRRLREKY